MNNKMNKSIGKLIVALLLISILLPTSSGSIVGIYVREANRVELESKENARDNPSITINAALAQPLFTSRGPIRIDSDSDFSNGTGVNWGDGSALDPYNISGWEIDASGFGCGIYIGNTSKYFIIQDCYVHNASGNSTQFYWNSASILFNVSNGKLVNNTFSDSENGTNLASCGNNTIVNNTYTNNSIGLNINVSNNNRIANNPCNLNKKYEVYVNNSDNNTIMNNTLSSTCTIGILLFQSLNNTMDTNSISNKTDGISLKNSNNNTLSNNTFSNNDFSISLEISSGNKIIYNNCSNNIYGIYLDSSMRNTIKHNNCSSNDGGIYLFSSSSNNTLENNTCNSNNDYGIWLDWESNNCSLINNTCRSNYDNGIFIFGSSNNSLINNTCNNNDIYGIWIDYLCNNTIVANNTCLNNEDGINQDSSFNSTIENNYCINNTGSGIFLADSHDNTIANNTCENNSAGINIAYSSSNNTLVNNTCSLNQVAGIKINTSNNNTIKYNKMDSNYRSITLLSSSYNILYNNSCINSNEESIFLFNSINNTIDNNNCSYNPSGVYLDSSSNNNIIRNNTLSYNGVGISIMDSQNNELYNNKMTQCGIILFGSLESVTTQEIPINNSVNGKPVYHYKNANMSNFTVPDNAGEVILGNVSWLRIENLNLTFASLGVLIISSNNIYIANNTCSNNVAGIFGSFLTNSLVKNNTCSNNMFYGIGFLQSNNNTYDNNTCSENDGQGIYLGDSNFNEIKYNNFENNQLYGVYLEDSSSGNTINHNNFINNNGGDAQGYDTTNNSYWNDTAGEGNYWDDYENRYVPPATNDGHVWDTPYDLAGAGSAKDNFPLAYPIEFNPPTIDDLSNLSGTTGENFTFKCNVSDNIHVWQVFVKYWFGDDVGNATNMTLEYNTTFGYYTSEIEIPWNSTEQLKYKLSAVDSSNNWANVSLRIVDITDNDPPVADAGTNIEANVQEKIVFDGSNSLDNIGILNYTWHFIYNEQEIFIYDVSFEFIFEFVDVYQVNLSVRDAMGQNDMDSINVTVRDLRKPEIYFINYPTSVYLDDSMEISARIEELSGVDSIKLNYTDVNDASFNVTMNHLNSDLWNYLIPAQAYIGSVSFFIWVNDTLGNWNRTITYDIDILDKVPPKVVSVDYPEDAYFGESFTINVEVFDNIGVSIVKLNYTDGDKVNYNVSMAFVTGFNYSYSIPGQSCLCEVTFYIWVLDAYDNWNKSGIHEVNIIEKVIIPTRPMLNWISVPSTVMIGETIRITIEVLDDNGVKGVYIDYIDTDGNYHNVTMTSMGNGQYTYITSSQITEGTLTLSISAVNSQDNWNTTEIRTISVRFPLTDTFSPHILSTIPIVNSMDVKINTDITIIFNESMDPTSLTSAITIDPSLAYEVTWSESHTILKLTFTEALGYAMTYTITIGETATDAAGNPLDNPYLFFFTTESEPKEQEKEKDGKENYNFVIFTIIIVILIIILLLALLMKRKDRVEEVEDEVDEEQDEEEEEEEEETMEEFECPDCMALLSPDTTVCPSCGAEFEEEDEELEAEDLAEEEPIEEEPVDEDETLGERELPADEEPVEEEVPLTDEEPVEEGEEEPVDEELEEELEAPKEEEESKGETVKQENPEKEE